MFPGLKKKAPPAAAEAKEVAQPVEQEQSAVIDRGIPKLNAGARGMPAAIKVVLIVSVIFALVGVAGTVALSKWKADRQMAEEEEAAPKGDTESKLPQLAATDFAETPLPPDAVAAQAQLDKPEAPPPAELPPSARAEGPGATGNRGSAGGSQGGYAVPALTAEQQQAVIEQRRQASPLFAEYDPPARYGGGQQSVATAMGSASPQDRLASIQENLLSNMQRQQAAALGQQNQPVKSSLESALESVSPDATNAQVLRDQSMTITQGSSMPCTLDTAINSQLPGMVRCTLSVNVYSADSRVVLLERGSKLVGQYQSGQLKQGMSRIFVLWTRVETPQGVIVALDSPGTDSLGRSGVTGKVNNHFWARFGAGLVLSVVDDALAYAAKAQNGNSTQTVQFDSTSQATQNAAAIAVQNSVNIPPTVSTTQGTMMNVFVARDLYFGGVYGLRTASR
ncbi:type IV secretion system protein VirB10 [Xanthomonas campestris pv. mirabilis]|uniref:type IV secretion system protein VirB10 n=2 Tax=Xanthomonas TaxID=338 RepID=UPI001C47F793|nr:type IV secretion system protein VirB10 [Xanthomonas euvesicatoria]MBV6855862.1 type IV secretion system protein VirB10 [Xanthomonas campestris pv. mirabilis]